MSTLSPTRIRGNILRAFPEAAAIRGPAWIVGGAVRDAVMGRHAIDVDIAAEGAETLSRDFASRQGGRLIELGRDRFVSWRVVLGPRSYDFAEISRGSIEEDLGRRDFTINAMALPVEGEADLIDPFGGFGDIDRGLVRMVRSENLEDDPLRVLKAVRMVSVLGFELEPDTAQACRTVAPRLRDVAAERLATELELILAGGQPVRAAGAFRQTGAALILFGREIPTLYSRLPGGDAALALASIFRSDPDSLRAEGAKLRLPGALVGEAESVLGFDRSLGNSLTVEDLDVLLYLSGEREARRGAALRLAAEDVEASTRILDRIVQRGEQLFSTEPLLTGSEILEITGIPPGPALGRLKKDLVLAQVRGEITTRQAAEGWVRERVEASGGSPPVP
jgi:tRNA nucleotidyltransferase (CCA-adding enzyme)